mmetsp:Transcript_20679/g.54054  ORF Transcript_20679/g.54054 Transcript_20679/m.54054 type:complete len:248 (-) Transcript_20679:594-1337(-)
MSLNVVSVSSRTSSGSRHDCFTVATTCSHAMTLANAPHDSRISSSSSGSSGPDADALPRPGPAASDPCRWHSSDTARPESTDSSSASRAACAACVRCLSHTSSYALSAVPKPVPAAQYCPFLSVLSFLCDCSKTSGRVVSTRASRLWYSSARPSMAAACAGTGDTLSRDASCSSSGEYAAEGKSSGAFSGESSSTVPCAWMKSLRTASHSSHGFQGSHRSSESSGWLASAPASTAGMRGRMSATLGG